MKTISLPKKHKKSIEDFSTGSKGQSLNINDQSFYHPKTFEEMRQEAAAELHTQEPKYPSDWHKGQLLNVRNTGESYIVTLHPEEYDPRSPERALHFQNSALCQNFVSQWYAREQGGRPW